MNISAKARLQWTSVAYLTVSWCIIGVLLALYKSVNYNPVTGEILFIAPKGYSIANFVLINMIGPFLAGIFAAPVIVFYLKEKLKTKSYLTFISIMGISFFLIILLLNTMISMIFYFREIPWEGSFSFTEFSSHYLLDPYAIRNILTWLLIGFISVTMLQVSDKYGPGVFNKLILGKYYHPQEEERIFMFLDLNSSTALAEKLGNLNFFKLISTYFSDITDCIIDRDGEIYQYVGDEIVVSWNPDRGLRNANCIHCYFDIRNEIKKKAGNYMEQFGVIPEFKGGIHMGKVTVGEIGIIKKDIVYSGDILNTTSRILELSKQHNQKLIISQAIYDSLAKKPAEFDFESLGQVRLRGKDIHMNLWTVASDIS